MSLESPLSFKSTKKVRDLLLSKNLADDLGEAGVGEDYPHWWSRATYELAETRELPVIDQGTVDQVGEFYIDIHYLYNVYGPEGGFGDMVDVNTIIHSQVNEGQYPNFEAPAGIGIYGQNQVGRCYSAGQILLGVTSEGLLSQEFLDDSLLAQLGAVQLKKEFQARIQHEVIKHTLGRVNALEAFTDPFAALDILTGRESLVERDFQITTPGGGLLGLAGKGLDFISRVTGVYLPFSYIPGDYFELEPPRGLSMGGKIISDITNMIGVVAGIPRRRQSGSDRFLEFTSGGQKSQLFKQLRYNTYGPAYGEAAQAQTALGRVFGEVVDFIGAVTSFGGDNPPNLPQYLGSRHNPVTDMMSPPTNNYAGENYVPVYGPDTLAKNFDPNTENFKFGLAAKTYSNEGNLPGGFTWFPNAQKSGLLSNVKEWFNRTISPDDEDSSPGTKEPGVSQGKGGSTDDTTRYDMAGLNYDETKSDQYELRENSILDVTQKIVDSQPKTGGARLKHVGNAIDQVSKVFNDGYKELTKGSMVRRYENTDPINQSGVEIAREYCRVWTKDIPYYKYDRLQKFNTNLRRETYSVVDSPYNLNIAPTSIGGSFDGSTNIIKDSTPGAGDGKVKKYMFSLENLAWRTSTQKGFTYADLPICERGPNGGRIMWFPPYDLSVDEASTANWTKTDFLGRPEPVFTYNNTNRTGTLKFKIVVDHPSILNVLVKKELAKLTPSEVDGIVDSFFAGCKKYDIFELAYKFKQFSLNELALLQQVVNETTDPETLTDLVDEGNTGTVQITEDGGETPPDLSRFNGLAFFFENDYPDPNTHNETSSVPFNVLAEGGGSKYGNKNYLKDNQDLLDTYQANQTDQGKKDALREWFANVAMKNYNTLFPELMIELDKILKEGKYRVSFDMVGGASSLAPAAYNVILSKRRLSSVKQMIRNYQIAGTSPFGEYIDNDLLQMPRQDAFGEEQCNSATSGVDKIFSVEASSCRMVKITGINFDPIPQEPDITRIKRPPTIKKIVEKTERTVKNTRREIANKLLMKMISECTYFEQLKDENEFVYKSLKEKLKFFHPAFHSITPEGLNARLTFLNQCVRPGETIPTKTEPGVLDSDLDARNTSFGAPPICVLRVGDFYNTKIAIDQVSFSYDDNLFDINPEGIGMQPMIASVNVTFNYIGGQGIKGPVNQLQNALSFNFFSNTEFYDDRALLTVTDDDPDEQIFLKELQDKYGQTGQDLEEIADEVQDEDTAPNDGLTIGDRVDVALTASGETGNIKYDIIFNEYNIALSKYISSSYGVIERIMTEYNYGLLQLVMSEREWVDGTFQIGTAYQTTTETTFKLLGKPKDVESKLETLFDTLEDLIKDKSSYIQKQHNLTNPSISKKNKLKNLLLDKLSERKTQIVPEITQLVTELTEAQIELTKYIDKLNAVNNGCDGYLSDGKPTIFKLSGMTQSNVHDSSPASATDTFIELGEDSGYIKNVVEYYVNALNGDGSGISCIGSGGLCATANQSVNSGDLTKTSKYVSPHFFEVNFPGLDMTNMSLEYLVLTDLVINKEVVDNQLNENFYYYSDVFGIDKTKTSEFWEEVHDKSGSPYSIVAGTWIYDTRRILNEAIVKNENHYLELLDTIKTQAINRFLGSDGTNEKITEGLTDTSGSNTIFVSTDKTRKFGYVMVSESPCEDSIKNITTQVNSSENKFNFKFNI